MRVRVCVLSALLLAGSLATPTPSARAVAPILEHGQTVALDGFADLWVSESSAAVVIAQDTNQVVIVDHDGLEADRVVVGGSTHRVTGSDDGTTAFAVFRSGSGVARIDLAARTSETLPLTGVPACITDAAFTVGLVWISYACSAGKGVVALDPTTGDQHVVSNVALASVEAVAASPGTLIGVTRSNYLARFTATGEAAPTLVKAAEVYVGSQRDFDIQPDGSAVVTTQSRYHLPSLAEDYTASGDAFNQSADHVAIDALGAVALSNEGWDEHGASVRLYTEQDYHRPFSRYEWEADHVLGLDLGPDGRLYVATDTGQGRLDVIVPRPGSTITGDADVYYPAYGDTITITGKVTSPAVNEQVQVYVQEPDRPRRLVATTTANDLGAYTVGYTAVRNHVVFVVYPGDENVAGSYDRVTRFDVDAGVTARLEGYDRVQGGIARYGSGDPVVLRGKVSPGYPGSRVSAEVNYWLKGYGWEQLEYVQMRLDSRSRFAARLKVGRSLLGKTIRIRGVFGKRPFQDYGYSEWLKFKVGR